MTTEFEQQAMDGSPARVTMTLNDLFKGGKFHGLEFGRLYNKMQPSDRYTLVMNIKFQCGPIGEVGVNGCSIEDVIDVLVVRLEGFQRGPFLCQENQLAIHNLRLAKEALLERTAKRQTQGVEGTNAAHVS